MLKFFPALVAPPEVTYIELLTKIRHNGYKLVEINSINTSQFSAICDLTTLLGERVLQVNCEQDVQNAKSKFKRVISALFKKNKFAGVVFSAQLLQYYTIVSDEDFVSGQSCEEFHEFLVKNTQKFGETTYNLLVTEYKIIKIFNDLDSFIESERHTIAPIDNIAKKMAFLLNQLNEIEPLIAQWIIDAPDNIFIQYLSFSLNYCYANAVLLQYSMKEKEISEEEKIGLSQTQQSFVEAAIISIETIEEISKAKVEKKLPFTNGAEFSLGQFVFSKVKGVSSIDPIKAHLNSLKK